MKKITKISLITAGISILLGVIFIFIGFVFGANVGCVYANGQFYTKEEINKTYKSDNYENIKNIYVNGEGYDIELVNSLDNTFSVEYESYGTFNKPEITVKDGQLKVEGYCDNNINGIFFDMFDGLYKIFSGDYYNKITINIPQNAQLEAVDIRTTNSMIHINSDFITDNLQCLTFNDKIQIDSDITVNKLTNLETTNDKIVCNGTFNKAVKLKTTNDKIVATGTFNCNLDCNTTNDKIELNLSNSENDYNIEAHTTNDKILVNEEKVVDEDNNKTFSVDNNADYKLSASTTNGKIELNFKN